MLLPAHPVADLSLIVRLQSRFKESLPKKLQKHLLLHRLQESTAQTLRMLHRVVNRSHGLKEQDMVCLVQAFVAFRIIYVALSIQSCGHQSTKS